MYHSNLVPRMGLAESLTQCYVQELNLDKTSVRVS